MLRLSPASGVALTGRAGTSSLKPLSPAFFHNAQHRPPAPVAAPAAFVGLLHFTERKRLPGRHFETAVVDELGHRPQDGA